MDVYNCYRRQKWRRIDVLTTCCEFDSMCIILQSGGHGHSHGGSPERVFTAGSHRTSTSRHLDDDDDALLLADNEEVMTVTTSDNSTNINVKAAFIHVIGDLLQSFGVLVAAYIIFYKVHSILLCKIFQAKHDEITSLLQRQ